ncbi:MAG: hypothetical protein LJE65_00205 [Desulfobacteraceae bacterium]|nr:hypothetical protein [Desulfobacteraceae bacterium]
MKELSRYEINQEVRRALLRHAVDLSQLQYSSTGTTVYLFGQLRKETKGDFTDREVEGMVRELSRLPGVREIRFELSNWMLMMEPGSFELHKKS